MPLPSRDDVRRLARRVYRTVKPAPLPPGRTFTYPLDVADPVTLRASLADTDLFGEARHEAEAYVTDALERFRITMALVPTLPSGARVLELGANPYFLTKLLRQRGLDVTCANWFGEDGGFGERGTQVVNGTDVYEFDHFNVERSTFPYPDASFDLVLCCEILEHLPNDPVHLLAECHRVLRQPNGTLLLTTPNATRLDNLTRMLAGDNVYEELSGHGTYGRHNREYTVAELRTLLSETGYVVDDVFATDTHEPPEVEPRLPPGVALANRGDNLFALARPEGARRWRYPRWLFASRHALRRLVRPDLAMGYNDDLQTAGFWDLEEMDGRLARWTGAAPEARVFLETEAGDATLHIEGKAPPSRAGDTIELVARVGATEAAWTIACDEAPFSVEAPVAVGAGEQEIVLITDRTWAPPRGDIRTLGIAITDVRVVPT